MTNVCKYKSMKNELQKHELRKKSQDLKEKRLTSAREQFKFSIRIPFTLRGKAQKTLLDLKMKSWTRHGDFGDYFLDSPKQKLGLTIRFKTEDNLALFCLYFY